MIYFYIPTITTIPASIGNYSIGSSMYWCPNGIGNIYADEALWRAGVNGARQASALTKPRLAAVLDAAAEVMAEALAQGGTSFDSLYVNVNGSSGYFERSLAAYGRHGLPCLRCGRPMVREPFMNRASHLCPRCQPRPRRRRAVAADA